MLASEGGGEVRRDGVRVTVRVGRPEDRGQDDAGGARAPPGAAAPAELASAAPALGRGWRPLSPAAPASAGAPAAAGAPAPPARGDAQLLVAAASTRRCGYRFYAERVLGLPPAPEARWRPGRDRRRRPAQRRRPGRAHPRAAGAAGLPPAGAARRPTRSSPRPRAPACRRGPGRRRPTSWPALVRRFADSELCARLGRRHRPRREERFAFPAGPAPGRPLVVGAIDVLAREPGAACWWSTTRATAWRGYRRRTVAESQYAIQRLVYALAALRAGAQAVEVAHCFLERPEAPVDGRVRRARTRRAGGGAGRAQPGGPGSGSSP